MPNPIPRLFDADIYTIPDTTIEKIRSGYLLAYRGNTRTSYESDLKLWLRWCADQGVDPMEATRSDIETYDLGLQSSGLRPSTRQRKLIAICGMYNWAEEEDIIPKSPGRYVRRPRVPHIGTGSYLERFEVGPFLAAAKERGRFHSALCHLLVYNGLRVSEAIGINIEHLAFAGGHRTVKIVRKGGIEAEAPLAPPTFRAVLLATDEREHGPLLLDANGHPMTRHSAARAVRLAAGRAGINKKIGPHSCRRTFASLALDAGVALRELQVDMAHADISTTAIYDRRDQNLDRHTTYVLSAYVGTA